MLDFLASFSVNQIIIYTIMLGLAIKGAIDFFEWCKDKYKQKFDKDYATLNKQETLEKHYIICQKQHQESMDRYKTLEGKIDQLTETMNQKVDKIESQLIQLTESDMHDIKGWIVEKHHLYVKKGWVDDFTMDTLERRFSDYVAEDGNSYIAGLMTEIRALPHVPPEEDE